MVGSASESHQSDSLHVAVAQKFTKRDQDLDLAEVALVVQLHVIVQLSTVA
jgi:hypothetical protein